MSDHSFMNGTRTGTLSGMLFVILSNIPVTDITRTALLAAVGAAVSFLVTLLMKWLRKKWK